jgi:RNA-directed DNA polymerase
MSFKIDFTRLKDKQQLISFLGIDESAFDEVLSFDPDRYDHVRDDDGVFLILSHPFFKHKIPKKSPKRGFRVVWEPAHLMTNYKALSRRLANFFSSQLDGFPHPRCFGYVGGRNIRENAQGHCGHKHLISLDLQEFFPSISSARIERFLASLGIAHDVAGLLSQFVTIGDKLALGLPTSPTIANAICLQMDTDLQAHSERYGTTFSRYADDISFSSDGTLPSIEEVEKIVRQHDFTLALPKTRRSTIGQAHYVTGLSVSDPKQPHVPKQKKRRLRQELYYAKRFGLDDHFRHLGINNPQIIQQEINRLDGLVKFTAFHEPQLATYLKTDWNEILQASGSRPSFEPKSQQGLPFFIFIDEAEFVRPDGEQVLALAMAVSQHQNRVHQGGLEVLQAYLADPWAAGDREAAIKRGIHFVDAHPDLRLKFVERMCAMPFEGYVAFAKLPGPEEYQATYLRLLNAMIKRRLMAAESKFARFVFERNDKVSQPAINAAVMEAFNALRKSNNRHPMNCFVDFKGKPDFGLSIPDFLLGSLKKFLELTPEKSLTKPARERLLFEQLRDRYRLILDADSWIEYSRRKPIAPWREAQC